MDDKRYVASYCVNFSGFALNDGCTAGDLKDFDSVRAARRWLAQERKRLRGAYIELDVFDREREDYVYARTFGKLR